MLLWNSFAKVVCKVPSALICLPSIFDDNDPPWSTVCKSASTPYYLYVQKLSHKRYWLKHKTALHEFK